MTGSMAEHDIMKAHRSYAAMVFRRLLYYNDEKEDPKEIQKGGNLWLFKKRRYPKHIQK